MPRIERGVLGNDGVQPLRQRRAGLGNSLPAVGRRDVGGGRQRRLVDGAARNRNDVILRALCDRAWGAVIRPLAPGALSEDATQAQEDEDRQRQEDDRIDIHFASFSLLSPVNGSGGGAFLS